jgi:Zn-dependent protease with chaperone function
MLVATVALRLFERGVVPASAWLGGNLNYYVVPLVVAGPLLVMLMVVWARYARAERRMDNYGDVRAYISAHRLAQRARVLGTGVFVLAAWLVNWPGWCESLVSPLPLAQALALLPLLFYYVMTWFACYPAERLAAVAIVNSRLGAGRPMYAFPGRVGFTVRQFNYNLLVITLPILMIGILDESAAWVLSGFGGSAGQATGESVVAERILPLVYAIITFVFVPPLIALAWRVTPLRDADLAPAAREMCARYNIKLRGPYIWPTSGLMINAVVLGSLHPLRYLLMTDLLLETLPAKEARAVLAHEIGHVRHRHLPWLLAVTLLTALSGAWVVAIAAFFAGVDTQSDTVALVASLFSVVVACLAFVWASRCFEYQADAFAASELSHPFKTVHPEGVYSMIQALSMVASEAGISIHAPSLRHGSIAQRQKHLDSLLEVPRDGIPIDRSVGRMKGIVWIMGLGNAALFAFEWYRYG